MNRGGTGALFLGLGLRRGPFKFADIEPKSEQLQ